MNNEENHGFTSFDFITMMVSFVVIALVTGPIIKKNIQSDQSLERARAETANIGRALLDGNRLPSMAAGTDYTPKTDRSVASLDKSEPNPKLNIETLKVHLKNGEWEGNILRWWKSISLCISEKFKRTGDVRGRVDGRIQYGGADFSPESHFWTR